MPVKPPAHTCPWIDRLSTIVRRHVRGEDRRTALALCEQLRGANLGLRVAYVDALTDAQGLRRALTRCEAACAALPGCSGPSACAAPCGGSDVP